MAYNAFCIIILSISFECFQQTLIKAHIVTAGTYYQMINKSVGQSDNNVPVLTEEMFRCSKNAGCGSLGNKENSYVFEEMSSGADRSGYGKILEKVKSGFKDCRELYTWGINEDTIVDISWQNGSSFQAYCDMTTDGGGWLVFQRRTDKTSFYRNWTEYKHGFGNMDGSFWLGLEALHWLTNRTENVVLRIDVTDNSGSVGYAKYQKFVIGSEAEKYKISFDLHFEGNIGDALARSRDMPFTTPDRDNDMHRYKNCAIEYRGGWWHSNCFNANLNNEHPLSGLKVSTPEAEGASMMSWYTWKDEWGTIRNSKMMLKVVD